MVDEILWCYHSNETSLGELLHKAIKILWMNYCKMEVLENIISQFQIPVNAHASIKDDTVLSYYFVFVWTGKND